MLQVRCGLDLGEKALRPYDGGQLGLQDLERHLAVVLDVFGQIDRCHTTLSEFSLDRVLAFEGGSQAGKIGEHGGQHPVSAVRCARKAQSPF